ncbi:hypothetical protein QFC21_004642 [Naganishia friedmannii]|uniref:Uncharacterized protein n=1 Tax=Naganishia friedmannii TaxID=89922 RepID=A0ACC2VEY2_9TREE|nr:hypothetical protein QFC21_004642 [Naganishia friedmannii]
MPSLAHTTLVIANPAQKRTIWRNMYQQWEKPKGCTWEVSLERNFSLLKTEKADCAVMGKQECEEYFKMQDGMETLRRDAKVLQEGQVKDVTSYVLTAVVTPPHHRKKGYATHMLSLLHYALALPLPATPSFPEDDYGPPPAAEHSPRDATFSTLWSDVGRDFYRSIRIGRGERSREGWVVGADREVRYELPPSNGEENGSTALPQGWRSFPSVSDIPSELLDTLSLRTLITARGDTSAKTLAYDAPTSPGILDFTIARAVRFTPAKVLERNEGAIQHVYINETTVPPSLIVLAPTYTPNEPHTLKISYLSLTPPVAEEETAQQYADLFTILYSRARMYSCTQVEGWQLPQPLIDAWEEWTRDNGGKLVSHVRDEHLGALAWYGEGPGEEVAMVGGQFYAWA